MRTPVGPTHSTSSATRCEMGPLHVEEIFVVECFRKCSALIFKTMYRAVFTIKERTIILDVTQCLPGEPARTDGCVHRIFRVINRVSFIKMHGRKIERRMPENTLYRQGFR